MSTSGIDSILTKVQSLSTEDKKRLIKRVVDLLGETRGRPKPQPRAGRRKAGDYPSRHRSTIAKSIAAYAARHGGGLDDVDLDTALEAASLEDWLDAECDAR